MTPAPDWGRISSTINDGKRIPFDDNKFDVVYTAGMFQHINFEERRKLSQKVLRVR